MPRLRPGKDLLAGLMFIGFGALGFWLLRPLDAGTASEMGAGYFPRAVSGVLVALGGLQVAATFAWGDQAPEGFAWRPFLLVTLSAVSFALLLRPLGLPLTLLVVVLLANAAGEPLGPIRVLLLAAGLIAVNVGIFVLGLRMPIPTWPAALG